MPHPDVVESGYGSDRTGLVWAYRFAPGEPATAVQAGEAELLAAGPPARDSHFLWLHLSLSNAGSERWLRQHLALPDSFHLLLHEDVGSTRVEQDGESLVAVIHDVLFDSTFDASDVSTLALCVQSKVLVSARPGRFAPSIGCGVPCGEARRSDRPPSSWASCSATRRTCWWRS